MNIKHLAKSILFQIPSSVSRNFRTLDKASENKLIEVLRDRYFIGWRSANRRSKQEYEKDMADHLYRRLEADRSLVVPWLDHAFGLKNKRIIEIGCGTGSSTVALAEQGARVTGIDIDAPAIEVAKIRAELYGVEASFQCGAADGLAKIVQSGQVDAIIYFACLEHMTNRERLASLEQAWDLLPVGGCLAVVETPNRLWYNDSHTAMLPFFHWLPDDMAFEYTRHSPRKDINSAYREDTDSQRMHFLRRGRGCSYHEFELAIGEGARSGVISSLSSYWGWKYALRRTAADRSYKRFLMRAAPGLHEGYFDEYLYLVLKKH